MSNIKVVSPPKKAGKPTVNKKNRSLSEEQENIKTRLRSGAKAFFPPWVFVVALSLFWSTILIGSMTVIVRNPMSGTLTALSLILVSALSVLAYPTYSAKWRTIAWAMFLSVFLTYIVTQLETFSGNLLIIIIPTLLLVFARSNMNLRRFIESRRNR